MRYLYKIHAKAATPLENEPKSDNPVKLTGFKFSAENANKTILGFNRILWTKDSGYAAPGEELNDLGAEDRDIHIMEECTFCFNVLIFTNKIAFKQLLRIVFCRLNLQRIYIPHKNNINDPLLQLRDSIPSRTRRAITGKKWNRN